MNQVCQVSFFFYVLTPICIYINFIYFVLIAVKKPTPVKAPQIAQKKKQQDSDSDDSSSEEEEEEKQPPQKGIFFIYTKYVHY